MANEKKKVHRALRHTLKGSVWLLFFVNMIIHFVLVKGMSKYNVYNFN